MRAGRSSDEGNPVGDPGRLDLGLRAGDPLTHGGLWHQEGAGDLGDGQPADQAQRQRDPGLHRQGRVAAGEDQPEPVVLDRRRAARAGCRRTASEPPSACRRDGTRGAAGRWRAGCAVVVIQPPGLGGTPSVGQRSTATANASAAISSAMSRSPKRLVSAATTRAHSSRWTRVIASATGVTRPGRGAPRPCPGRPSIRRRPA